MMGRGRANYEILTEANVVNEAVNTKPQQKSVVGESRTAFSTSFTEMNQLITQNELICASKYNASL